MPVIRASAADVHHVHGAEFASYARPSAGTSTQLCGWRLRVPAGTTGAPHRPDREELLLVLDGDLHVQLDGVGSPAGPGDVVVVPADAELQVDGGAQDALAWVTTTAGLTATLADGTRLSPPWAR